jgi:hypothetical protein
MFRPAARFLIAPRPPDLLAARFLAAVILPPLLFFAILKCPPLILFFPLLITKLAAGSDKPTTRLPRTVNGSAARAGKLFPFGMLEAAGTDGCSLWNNLGSSA